MSKFLPLAWLTLIPFSVVLTVLAGLPVTQEYGAMIYIGRAFSLFQTVFVYAAYAAIYALFRRVAANPWVFRLGWVHVISAPITLGFSTYIWFMANQALATRAEFTREHLMLFSGISAVFGVIGTLSLFGAAAAAFYSSRKRIELQAFD